MRYKINKIEPFDEDKEEKQKSNSNQKAYDQEK